MAALGYVTVASNNLGEARRFYDALLSSAGIRPLWEHPSGGRIHGNDGGTFCASSLLTMAGLRRSATARCSLYVSTRGSRWTCSMHAQSRSAAPTRVPPASERRPSTCPTFATSMATRFAPTALARVRADRTQGPNVCHSRSVFGRPTSAARSCGSDVQSSWRRQSAGTRQSVDQAGGDSHHAGHAHG